MKIIEKKIFRPQIPNRLPYKTRPKPTNPRKYKIQKIITYYMRMLTDRRAKIKWCKFVSIDRLYIPTANTTMMLWVSFETRAIFNDPPSFPWVCMCRFAYVWVHGHFSRNIKMDVVRGWWWWWWFFRNFGAERLRGTELVVAFRFRLCACVCVFCLLLRMAGRIWSVVCNLCKIVCMKCWKFSAWEFRFSFGWKSEVSFYMSLD